MFSLPWWGHMEEFTTVGVCEGTSSHPSGQGNRELRPELRVVITFRTHSQWLTFYHLAPNSTAFEIAMIWGQSTENRSPWGMFQIQSTRLCHFYLENTFSSHTESKHYLCTVPLNPTSTLCIENLFPYSLSNFLFHKQDRHVVVIFWDRASHTQAVLKSSVQLRMTLSLCICLQNAGVKDVWPYTHFIQLVDRIQGFVAC